VLAVAGEATLEALKQRRGGDRRLQKAYANATSPTGDEIDLSGKPASLNDRRSHNRRRQGCKSDGGPGPLDLPAAGNPMYLPVCWKEHDVMDELETRSAKDTTLSISGMTCSGCASTVTRILSRAPGVERAEVDFESGRACVAGTARPEDLIRAVEAAGYGAQIAKDVSTGVRS
jgi:copper chaperone CopZ